MNTENNLFNILNLVTKVNTISEISDKLFLSQPYISKIINQAEKKYNVTLVNRNQKPIRLTKAGQLVLDSLSSIISARNQLEYSLAAFKETADDQIKIAVNQPWLETDLDGLTNYLVQTFPEITFSFYEQTTNIGQDSLLNHAIDIFIGKVLVKEKIECDFLGNVKLFFIIPENSPLFQISDSALSAKCLKSLSTQNYISLTDDSFFQSMVDHFFQDHDIEIHKFVKVENSISAIKLALAGNGFTIGMKDLAQKIAREKHCKVKFINIPPNELLLSIGVSRLTPTNPLIEKICRAIEMYLNTHPFY